MKNLLWITIDSLRYDHTSLSSPDIDTTPNIKSVVDNHGGLSFDHCFSSGIKTGVSTASMLTGTQPIYHHIRGNPNLSDKLVLDGEIETVADRLQRNGFDTWGVSTNGFVSPASEISRGIEDFTSIGYSLSALPKIKLKQYLTYGLDFLTTATKFSTRLNRYSHMPAVAAKVTTKLNEYPRNERPYFGYVHINETHRPYDPPRDAVRTVATEKSARETIDYAYDMDERMYEIIASETVDSVDIELLSDLYDEEIKHVDEYLAPILEAIDFNETIVVITGDHGEFFGEYGLLGHQILARDESTHVPLVVAGLDADIDTTSIVQHIDIIRTLLEYNGLPTDGIHGVDLLSDNREYAFTEWHAALDLIYDGFESNKEHAPVRGNCISVRSIDQRYVSDSDRGVVYEPKGTEPLDEDDVEHDFESIVEEYRDQFYRDPSDESFDDTEIQKHLRDLGYV